MSYKTILFFLLISPCAVYAQPSTKSFLDHIDSDKYDIYLYGLEAGLDWANEFTYRKHNYEIFCKPSNIVQAQNDQRYQNLTQFFLCFL